jgi:hypothetical protein
MSKTIWKFQLETTDIQQIEMPADAEILTIQTQDDKPCIWALVSADAPIRKVAFEIFGTGHPVPKNGKRKYIGTYQLSGGALVFHCFELFGLI